MAFFPMDDTAKGISGALVFGKTYEPSITGTIVYINTKNIDKTNKLIVDNGGKIVYPKTSIGDMGFVAEFIDVAGNRVALHQDKNPK
jgi:predicted enzyme related to lactoylglutathione lyase